MCVCNELEVRKARAELLRKFEYDDIGEVEEYLGCKMEMCPERKQGRLTQLVILHSSIFFKQVDLQMHQYWLDQSYLQR